MNYTCTETVLTHAVLLVVSLSLIYIIWDQFAVEFPLLRMIYLGTLNLRQWTMQE